MSSGPDANWFCFLNARFCVNIICTKSTLNASILLLHNASICNISTQNASIFLLRNASTLPTHYITKKKSKCTNYYIGAKCVVSTLISLICLLYI